MKDFNEIFKKIEDSLADMDEKINSKLSALYDKLDEYRDTFKKNTDKKSDEVFSDKDDVIIVNDDKHSHTDAPKRKGDKLVEMAPFLDSESLHELVTEFCDGDLETDMAEILPFLEDADILLLAKKIKESGDKGFKGLCFDDLFPFVDEECFDELFMEKFNRGELDESLFPYLSDDCWHKLVVKYCENEESNLNIDEIYPFLNEADLKLLFKTYLKRRKPDA